MLHLPAQTRCRATPHPSATPTAVSLRLGQARFSVSTGDRFIAAPLLRSPRGEAKENVRGRMFKRYTPTCPRCAACTESSPLIPHAVVVSLPSAGVKGVSPLQLFLFLSFSFSGERKTDRRRRSRIISVAKLPHSKQPIHNPRNRSTHNGAGRKIKFF